MEGMKELFECRNKAIKYSLRTKTYSNYFPKNTKFVLTSEAQEKEMKRQEKEAELKEFGFWNTIRLEIVQELQNAKTDRLFFDDIPDNHPLQMSETPSMFQFLNKIEVLDKFIDNILETQILDETYLNNVKQDMQQNDDEKNSIIKVLAVNNLLLCTFYEDFLLSLEKDKKIMVTVTNKEEMVDYVLSNVKLSHLFAATKYKPISEIQQIRASVVDITGIEIYMSQIAWLHQQELEKEITTYAALIKALSGNHPKRIRTMYGLGLRLHVCEYIIQKKLFGGSLIQKIQDIKDKQLIAEYFMNFHVHFDPQTYDGHCSVEAGANYQIFTQNYKDICKLVVENAEVAEEDADEESCGDFRVRFLDSLFRHFRVTPSDYLSNIARGQECYSLPRCDKAINLNYDRDDWEILDEEQTEQPKTHEWKLASDLKYPSSQHPLFKQGTHFLNHNKIPPDNKDDDYKQYEEYIVSEGSSRISSQELWSLASASGVSWLCGIKEDEVLPRLQRVAEWWIQRVLLCARQSEGDSIFTLEKVLLSLPKSTLGLRPGTDDEFDFMCVKPIAEWGDAAPAPHCFGSESDLLAWKRCRQDDYYDSPLQNSELGHQMAPCWHLESIPGLPEEIVLRAAEIEGALTRRHRLEETKNGLVLGKQSCQRMIMEQAQLISKSNIKKSWVPRLACAAIQLQLEEFLRQLLTPLRYILNWRKDGLIVGKDIDLMCQFLNINIPLTPVATNIKENMQKYLKENFTDSTYKDFHIGKNDVSMIVNEEGENLKLATDVINVIASLFNISSTRFLINPLEFSSEILSDLRIHHEGNITITSQALTILQLLLEGSLIKHTEKILSLINSLEKDTRSEWRLSVFKENNDTEEGQEDIRRRPGNAAITNAMIEELVGGAVRGDYRVITVAGS
eukprot:m.45777 g.45777  ORF g.45777 m.45777 type:complete len:904 (+) comp10294_c0_seq2:393-3104(+)